MQKSHSTGSKTSIIKKHFLFHYYLTQVIYHSLNVWIFSLWHRNVRLTTLIPSHYSYYTVVVNLVFNVVFKDTNVNVYVSLGCTQLNSCISTQIWIFYQWHYNFSLSVCKINISIMLYRTNTIRSKSINMKILLDL